MAFVEPVTLALRGVQLVPLGPEHEDGLRAAAADGELWKLRVTGVQRSHVNTTCKLMLLTHAFETLGCHVVGWRTDNFNFASQAAIERLGAKKDGVIHGQALRRDGTIRDTVMYSLTQGEWPEARAQLRYLLDKPRQTE